MFIQIKEIASTPTKLLLAYKPDKEIEIILDSLYYKQILCTYSIWLHKRDVIRVIAQIIDVFAKLNEELYWWWPSVIWTLLV